MSEQSTLFRKKYRPLTEAEAELHDAIKDKADELARLFEQVIGDRTRDMRSTFLIEDMALNRGANVTLALRHLEDAVYRAVKALTT